MCVLDSFWRCGILLCLAISALVTPSISAVAAAPGALDASFQPDFAGYLASSIVARSDGKILLGGTGGPFLVGLYPDGQQKWPNWWLPNMLDGEVRGLAPADDGKVYLWGSFTAVGTELREGLARLNVDGTLDLTFRPKVQAECPWCLDAILVQSDNRLLVSLRDFTGMSPMLNLVRLNLDGAVDDSFQSAEWLHPRAAQPDGKILVQTAHSSRPTLSRLNSDGSLDATFRTNLVIYGALNAIGLVPGGKIIIAGGFREIDGTTRSHIARLHHDGTLDLDFDSGVSSARKSKGSNTWKLRAGPASSSSPPG